MTRHVLAVRLDSMGDMLVTGPAIRALAAAASRVTVLAGPGGAAAARLLPGVTDVAVWSCPWIAADPAPVTDGDVADVVERVRALAVDEAVIFTSFHQSALPTALVLRLAGVPRIAAVSVDYPGALLDVRLPDPPDAPEPERMLAIAAGAGFPLPPGDDGRLALRRPLLPPVGMPRAPYVVVHPGASAPARSYPPQRWAEVVAALTARGLRVAVTGSAAERPLTSSVAAAAQHPGHARDWGGLLGLMELAALLDGAATVISANTGPGHLAAAVGTPVVSLFAPTVPALRWAPYGVPVVLLGDQQAPCRDSRALTCPVPGHPCLATVTAEQVCAAVEPFVPAGVAA